MCNILVKDFLDKNFKERNFGQVVSRKFFKGAKRGKNYCKENAFYGEVNFFFGHLTSIRYVDQTKPN